MFYVTINFERFQYFKTDFLENENLFQKTGVPFPHKIALSKANVKANIMVSTNWAYHKEENFV